MATKPRGGGAKGLSGRATKKRTAASLSLFLSYPPILLLENSRENYTSSNVHFAQNSELTRHWSMVARKIVRDLRILDEMCFGLSVIAGDFSRNGIGG